jgi:hypothetical protein
VRKGAAASCTSRPPFIHPTASPRSRSRCNGQPLGGMRRSSRRCRRVAASLCTCSAPEPRCCDSHVRRPIAPAFHSLPAMTPHGRPSEGAMDPPTCPRRPIPVASLVAPRHIFTGATRRCKFHRQLPAAGAGTCAHNRCAPLAAWTALAT